MGMSYIAMTLTSKNIKLLPIATIILIIMMIISALAVI